MISSSACARRKMALDEGSFEKLLAAVYVLQKHSDSGAAGHRPNRLAVLSAPIDALRFQIASACQDLASAARLMADRLRVLASADGVTICLVRDGYLRTLASSGATARVPGGSVAAHSLIATERLRNGHLFQSSNARADIRLDLSICPELQISSLLTIPVQRRTEVVGLVELRWNEVAADRQWDGHASELIVSLAGEMFDREFGHVDDAPITSDSSSGLNSCNRKNPATEEQLPTLPGSSAPATVDAELTCRICGHVFMGGEELCVSCGTFRPLEIPGKDLQSKWASLWFMQQAQVSGDDQPRQAPVRRSPGHLSNTAASELRSDEIAPDLGEIKRKQGSVASPFVPEVKRRAAGE